MGNMIHSIASNFGMGNGAHVVYEKGKLEGKVIIVTGANTGIGFATAVEYAKLNPRMIIISCRTQEKGDEAIQKMKEQLASEGSSSTTQLECIPMELSNLRSVRQFAAEFKSRSLPLHILFLNAGLAGLPKSLTEEGYEMHLGVNHIAHFLLTLLLIDDLKASAPSRVIFNASHAHTAVRSRPDFSDINYEKTAYSTFAAYARSKLANILFSNELARRLQGTGVTVNSFHPGFVASDVWRHSGAIVQWLVSWVTITPKVSAITPVRLAADPTIANVTGKYWMSAQPYRGTAFCDDRQLQKELWDLSLKWANIKDPLPVNSQ